MEFSDQRSKTGFVILASTGIRIGALGTLRVGDLEKIDDIYKIRVYSGDKEEYITFCTPECAKEIDTYLDFRKRHHEKITFPTITNIIQNNSITSNLLAG